MGPWQVLGVVAVAGALGGVVAALLSEDKGFALPRQVKDASSAVWRPGFVGLIVVGAAAAALSFALYGPLASETVIGGPDNADDAIANSADGGDDDFGLTLAALGGAFLVGVSGSKWLSSQVDKSILRASAAEAAGRQGDAAAAESILTAAPTEALRIARKLAPR